MNISIFLKHVNFRVIGTLFLHILSTICQGAPCTNSKDNIIVVMTSNYVILALPICHNNGHDKKGQLIKQMLQRQSLIGCGLPGL